MIVLHSPATLVIHRIFDTTNFLNHRRVRLQSFSLLSSDNSSLENRNIPLLGKKFFVTWNFLKHRSVPLRSFLALWDKKFLKGKRDKPPNPLRLVIQKKFRYQKFCETQKFSPTKFFGTVRQRILNEDRDIPLCCKKNFRYQKIFKAQKASSTNFFGTIKQQIFVGISGYSLRRHKITPYQKVCETQKGSSTKCFGTARQDNFDGKRDARPRFFPYLFSMPQTFWNTEGFPYNFILIFRYCETKKLDRKFWY